MKDLRDFVTLLRNSGELVTVPITGGTPTTITTELSGPYGVAVEPEGSCSGSLCDLFGNLS